MISCYELRIGNFVLVDENLQQVTMITDTSVFTVGAEESGEQVASEYELQKINPVVLTDEVLKESGFVFHDYFKFWQLVTTDIWSDMDIDRDYSIIDFTRRPILKKLTSLHQLQNIYFMLKNKELKVANKGVQLA